MPLLIPCLCSITSSVESAAAGGGSGIAGATSGSSHSSFSVSDVPSSAASFSDDTVSVLTHPSLPSLQSLIPPLQPSPHFSASFSCLASLSTPSSGTGSAALAACATSLHLYAATESFISVYDLSDLHNVENIPSPSGAGATKSILLSPDSAALFTAHQDGRIRVWSRSSRSGLFRLQTSLPTPADQLLRFPLPKNYVTTRRHRKRLWIKHADAVSSIATSASGLFYSVSWDKTLKVWSFSGLRCLESVQAHHDAINAVAVAADGTVYTGSADRRIRVWAQPPGTKQHELVATLDRHRSAVNALALSSDDSVLYSGACDRSVLVWEREESADYMAVTGALRGHERAILCLVCVGEVVISGSSDRTVRVWRREITGGGYSCLSVMEGHAKGVRSLAAVRMPNGDGDGEQEYRVCSGSLDGEVVVWRVRVNSVQLK